VAKLIHEINRCVGVGNRHVLRQSMMCPTGTSTPAARDDHDVCSVHCCILSARNYIWNDLRKRDSRRMWNKRFSTIDRYNPSFTESLIGGIGTIGRGITKSAGYYDRHARKARQPNAIALRGPYFNSRMRMSRQRTSNGPESLGIEWTCKAMKPFWLDSGSRMSAIGCPLTQVCRRSPMARTTNRFH
jgi:hypothetical protein